VATKAGVGMSRHHNPNVAGREAAEQALEKAIKDQLEGEKPKVVFQFECGTRGKMMLRDQEKLQFLRQFRQSVGADVPWAGFYTWGEIGPVEEHNLRHLYTVA
jgi:small ligand-binding sensory domain FIST